MNQKYENITIPRLKVTATLTTKTFLHIGSGEIKENSTDTSKYTQDIARDCCDYPYIPAPSIKGAVRHIAKKLLDKETFETLFGYQDKDNPDTGSSGKVIFENAYLSDKNKKEYFSDTEIHNSIDRDTGAAKSHHLFEICYVPEGVVFDVILTAENLNPCEEKALYKILSYLKENQLQLGGHYTNGWGECEINIDSVKVIETEALTKFFRSDDKALHEYYEEADWKEDFQPLEKNELIFEITLKFETPFLVNDPSRIKSKQDKTHDDPDLTYRLKDGKVFLPASSFRGAFRSQAERICRTIEKDEKETIEYLFGKTDFRSVVNVGDFTTKETFKELEQDFVAIDRFTGGSSNGAKFKAKAIQNPILKEKISLDLERLQNYDANKKENITPPDIDMIKKLFALTLRDLIEGDITFGYGASKGYGVCTATINLKESKLDDEIHKEWHKDFTKFLEFYQTSETAEGKAA